MDSQVGSVHEVSFCGQIRGRGLSSSLPVAVDITSHLDKKGACSYFVLMPNPIEPRKTPVEDRTLRDLFEDRMMLFFECTRCERLSRTDVLDLACYHGADVTVGKLAKKARCTRCGTRKAEPLLRLPYGRGDFPWLPRPPKASR